MLFVKGGFLFGPLMRLRTSSSVISLTGPKRPEIMVDWFGITIGCEMIS